MSVQPKRFLERLPLARDMPALGYGAAVALAVVACVLRFALDPVLPPGYPYLPFFPAIIVTAFLYGRGPGVLCALLSGLMAWYFFVAPHLSFALTGGVALSLGFFAMVAGIDILLVHWMQGANHRLLAERERSHRLAETRALLFRELQHRVSNNLQVVGALLSLQKREIADDAARAAIDEAARRLGLIGKIHRQLYDTNGRPIGMAAFLRQLCDDVVDAAGAGGVTCTIAVDEGLSIDAEATVPVALIVAEAVSNAIEHGFAGRETGTIAVTLARTGPGRATLTIADDGHGLPPGFTLDAQGSLGLRIAATLARQLGGTFALEGGAGACARLDLPVAG